MIEVKADGLETSFEAVEQAGLPPHYTGVRPMLAGGRPGGAAFEGFLRSGSGLEMKAASA